jgi:hypothetical protein
MSECKDGSCKPKQECNSEKKCSTGCEMTDKMLCLSNQAWAELMKEKMKAAYEKHKGEKMDKMADAVVKATIEKWEVKMKAKMQCHKTKEDIMNAMMHH